MGKEYRAHQGRIPYGADTEKLYRLEGEINKAIHAATDELIQITDIAVENWWTEGLPTELYAVLDSWDRNAVRAAIKTWLEVNGK